MNEEQDIELIELYIQNKLDEVERERVDVRLKTESNFQALFTDVEILLQGVRVASRQELARELKSLEENLSAGEKETIPLHKNYRWIGVAASLTLLIVITFLWTRSGDSVNEKLFTAHYKPYPNVIAPSVRGENDGTAIALAFQNYDQEKYSEAIDELERLEKKDYRIFFYLGSSYLATRDSDKAILNFEKCLQTDNKLNAQAEWYLALSYLLKNDRRTCITMFKQIVTKNTPYAKDANEILTQLHRQE